MMAKRILRVPRLRSQVRGEETRHATWLELFFDLIFVVAVAQLSSRLAHGIRFTGLASFVALFLPVWWSWIGTTFYATRFVAADDLIYRLLAVIEMGGVAALAINVRDGFGATATGFALSYAVVRVVLVIQYLRAGWAIPEARPLTNHFARGFGLAAAIWGVSVFVPGLAHIILCGIGLAVDIGTPLFAGRLQTNILPDDSHLPERFGQFTLIVLGEGAAAVVLGIGQQTLTHSAAISAICALIIAFCLAWLYFENLDGSAIQAARAEGHIVTYQVWLYVHFPLVVALTAMASGVQYVVTNRPGAALPDSARWLLCGALALCLATIGAIHWTSAAPAQRALDRARTRLRIVASILILIFAFASGHLSPVLIMGFLATICTAQVLIDLRNDGEIAAHGEVEPSHEGVEPDGGRDPV
ncbi:MAG: low temperature requirement protein A [Chloroflexota bacterium]|nr:low temperature requirement protein A [Chloroflexota bacterium]